MKLQSRSKLLQHTFLSGVVGLAALSAASVAMAQTAPASGQQAQSEPVTEVDAVVVTGSRIRLQDYVAPNPVTTVTAETIENSGQTNLVQFLQDVPALVDSIDSETGADVNNNFLGFNLLDLRNLGFVRTLVLVDGRRHIAAVPGTSAVDIAQIPVALIDRTEILTGGASAIYGADGVSGVVNFVLKDSFEGLDMRSQYGWSDKGGGENTFVSVLAGRDFQNGRGNLMIGAEYDKTEDLDFQDRSFTRIGQLATSYNNPDDGVGVNDDPNVPDNLIGYGLNWFDTSLEGSVYTNFANSTSGSGVSFLGDGSPWIDGIQVGNAQMIGGSGTPLEAFNDDLIPGQERYTLYARGTYELSPNHEVFADIKYTSSTSDFLGQPSYDYGLFISLDNPYIPASIRADAVAPGGLGTVDGANDLGLPGPGVLIAKDNFYLGRLGYEAVNESLRGVLGLRGSLTAGIDYEVSLVVGEAENTTTYENVRLADRYYAATDVVINPATGNPVCRSNLDPTALAVGDFFGQLPFTDPSLANVGTFTRGPNSGCIPLNPFGLDNADPAAIDWVMGDGQTSAKLEQTVLNAFITGDSEAWFSLPAGPVSFVFGGEYREERSTSVPDPLQTLAESVNFGGLSDLGRAVATRGEYDVKEVFTEVSVPLLRDLPFADELTLSAAYRYSEYSSVGETDTWNVGLRYRPIQDVMFRATKAFAVRAPNINDLYAGRRQTSAGFLDPCDLKNIANGENPANRLANCQAAFTALGVDLSTYEDTSSETTLGFITGNPLLNPEEADSETFGVVINPRFAPGLALSFDYYSIEIEGAIASFTVQTIINNCYDLEPGNEFCALITRGTPAVNPGRVISFDQVPGNLQTFSTSGLDFGARYALDPSILGIQRDIGQFTFTLNGNYLESLEAVVAPGAPVRDDKGVEGAPEWQANFDVTWEFRNFSVNYGYSWFDKTSRVSNVTLDTQPDNLPPEWMYYDERSVHDLQARYEVSEQFSVYGGVNNITDQEPQPIGFGDASYPVSSLGRYFYIGLNAAF